MEKNGFSKLNSKKALVTFYKVKNNSADFYLNAINEIEKVRKKK